MAVKEKEKAAFQENWEKAEANTGPDIPDGTYQLKILKKTSKGEKTGFTLTASSGKPVFMIAYKIVGGDEEYVGQEVFRGENLETRENMGWFKNKLTRLNVTVPESAEEVEDGTLASELIGKVFEGRLVTKNNFLNVYVNRLLEDKGGEDEGDDGDEKESGEIEEGSKVTWNGKTGEVVELIDDGEKARVEKEDGTVVKVDVDKLELVKEEEEDDEEEDEDEDEEEEEEEEEEEDEDDDDDDDEDDEKDEDETEEVEVPEPDAVDDMSASDVKKALKSLDFDASELKNPRAVLKGFCILAHDSKGKLDLEMIAPLAAALEVKVKKGASLKDSTKALSAAVQKRLG